VNPATTETDQPKTMPAILLEDFVRKVKVIQARRGGSIAKVVATYGGPGIDAEYRKVLDEMSAELTPAPGA
jgi:hypothetical protein